MSSSGRVGNDSSRYIVREAGGRGVRGTHGNVQDLRRGSYRHKVIRVTNGDQIGQRHLSWGLLALQAFQYRRRMPSVTPAQLSLELNIDQKRIRDALRGGFGTLPARTTRWELTDEQADAVRSQFSRPDRSGPPIWTLEPGDRVRRQEIHAAYKGSEQNGIVTLKTRSDILVFTSVASGSQFGYHVLEGLREDGSFSYTGEGQRGDQVFHRGNRALRDSGPDGRPIRLFLKDGTSAIYVGEFATGNPTCSIDVIPDADGNPRKGIIFNLVPVNADTTLLFPRSVVASQTVAQVSPWTPPDKSDVIVVNEAPQLPGGRVVSRVEFALQSSFGEWIRTSGSLPERLTLTSDGTTIQPDLYVASRGWIVEAKKSSGREYVRSAIGQVLDYVHVAERANIVASPVILLPGRPTADVVALLARLGIILATPADDGFELLEPLAGTSRQVETQ